MPALEGSGLEEKKKKISKQIKARVSSRAMPHPLRFRVYMCILSHTLSLARARSLSVSLSVSLSLSLSILMADGQAAHEPQRGV